MKWYHPPPFVYEEVSFFFKSHLIFKAITRLVADYHLPSEREPGKGKCREGRGGEDDEEVGHNHEAPRHEPDATTLQMIMNLMAQCARLRTQEITFSHRTPEELDAPNAPFSIKDYDSFDKSSPVRNPQCVGDVVVWCGGVVVLWWCCGGVVVMCCVYVWCFVL